MQTNWKVVAGAPGAGKSSLIDRLAALGHAVRPEGATLCIQSQLDAGRLLGDICAVHNQPALQAAIASTNAALEAEIAHQPDHPFVFDRCLIEVLAYCRLYRHGEHHVRKHFKYRYHPRVLLLDRLPFKANQVRCEDDKTASLLDGLIEEVYTEEGYNVVRIPVPVHPDLAIPEDERIAWSINKRIRIMLAHWNN